MRYKAIYEFLLWDNCTNNCSFCFQRENPRIFNKSKRQEILDETLSFIQSDKFEKGSHILICGGEIFDKPQDSLQLNHFFTKIISLMLNDIIDLLYINTNLIYKDKCCLDFLLRNIKANNLFDRLKFTTSYDLVGRFKTKESEELMLQNLTWVKNIYPDCKVVVNTILTKRVCNAILNRSFSIKDFIQKYKCWVNLLPYIIYNKELSATRGEIFSALKEVDKDVSGYLDYYIPNMSITQEKLLYLYKDGKFEFCSCKMAECGHSINFKRYSDKGTCFCCDLKEILGK